MLGVGLAAIVLVYVSNQPFNGRVLQPVTSAPAFTLQTASGAVQLDDYRGKVVLLYFGYTFCPDACPITLSKLNTVYQKLGKQAEGVQVVFISVDPERDTPQILAEYTHRFNPAFVGATGTLEEITALTRAYNIFYRKVTVDSAAGYLVDHTTSVQVVDKTGQLRLAFPIDMEADKVAADLRKLLKE